MRRGRTFVTGLVGAVLAGGIPGVLLVALVTRAVPDQAVAVGTALAGGVGYLVAWLIGAARRPVAGPEPSTVPTQAPAPEVSASQEMPRTVLPARGEPRPASPDTPGAAGAGSDLLPASLVLLAGEATGREAAIDEVGGLLVAAGAVDPEYVAAMQQRERGVSTHMGNLLAVPHGDHDARRLVRRSALALVRYPETIDWHGNRVRFVVATAGVDDADQVRLVSRVAEVFLDEAAVARLEAAEAPEEAAAVFAQPVR